MTEFEEKREKLARFLLELYYGEGSWDLPDYESLQENYRVDAAESLVLMPHLLSAQERVRMWRDEEWTLRNIVRRSGELTTSVLTEWRLFYEDMKEVVE